MTVRPIIVAYWEGLNGISSHPAYNEHEQEAYDIGRMHAVSRKNQSNGHCRRCCTCQTPQAGFDSREK